MKLVCVCGGEFDEHSEDGHKFVQTCRKCKQVMVTYKTRLHVLPKP